MEAFRMHRLLHAFILFSISLFAAPQSIRWTGAEDSNADLVHIVDKISKKTGLNLSISDFLLIENRPLATSEFTMLAQVASKLPIDKNSIRIWRSRENGQLIQMEARVEAPPSSIKNRSVRALTTNLTSELVRRHIKRHSTDRLLQDLRWEDAWVKEIPVREVRAKGRHGYHRITLHLETGKVLSYYYEEFPQIDDDEPTLENIPAQVYSIYEEDDESGKIYGRVNESLRYLSPVVARPTSNPYVSLAENHYLETMFDPILGMTLEGRKKGYWAMSYVKGLAAEMESQLPMTPNTFENGTVLEGRYATINLHPDAVKTFQLSFTPAVSAQFRPDWKPSVENPDLYEMIPTSTFRGKALKSYSEAWNRPARRDPKHDAVSYIADGFDEVQVYWAVTRMFEALKPMGFTDPELSTRKFHAFLYDPDISYRDNAYYTDDTINFTTYSPKQGNMARDNSTIWHELGHGVMDRLMGDHLRLADTGGLSEGMADFVAQLVLNDVTAIDQFEGYQKMRIVNNTGFNLTNEVHDDGEAYGGVMNDFLMTAIQKWGHEGLHKVTDMVLEGMRLSRNHPGLTANDWFERLLFADQLGHAPIRKSGELRELLLQSLASRNFSLTGSQVASYGFSHEGVEVIAGAPGSRQKPIPFKLKADETTKHSLVVALKSTDTYHFRYPVQVRVQLRGGPIQGAIHWEGEENQPLVYTLKSEEEKVQIDLTARGTCDEVNRPDGSCVDFAYVQIWNDGAKKPAAKKRFYLQIHPQSFGLSSH